MRNKWFGWFLGVSVSLMAYQAWAENITVSTYYPSPFGSYTQLDAVTTLNVGPTGAPTIVMTGATGAMTATTVSTTGAVTGASFAAGPGIPALTPGIIMATTLNAVGNVNAPAGNVDAASATISTSVTAGSLITGGMTISGASSAVGRLQVVLAADGKYYAQAVYS